MMTIYDFWSNVWAVGFPGYFITENAELFKFFGLVCTLATVYVAVKYMAKLCKWICGGKLWDK